MARNTPALTVSLTCQARPTRQTLLAQCRLKTGAKRATLLSNHSSRPTSRTPRRCAQMTIKREPPCHQSRLRPNRAVAPVKQATMLTKPHRPVPHLQSSRQAEAHLALTTLMKVQIASEATTREAASNTDIRSRASA
jgi:hypothetical protein